MKVLEPQRWVDLAGGKNTINGIDQIDQTNQINQTDEIDQIDQSNQIPLDFSEFFVRIREILLDLFWDEATQNPGWR